MTTALLAAGRTADVFDLGDGRVLRRYRGRELTTTAEATLMRHLHEAGFPVPEVHAARGRELVMARVDGPTLAAAALSGTVSPADVGTVLAELHEALERVGDPGAIEGIEGIGTVAGAADVEQGRRVLHLDLHPENVLLGPDGPVVIDWSNAAIGPGGCDAALTALVLAQVVDRSQSPVAQAVRAALAGFLLRVGPLREEHRQWAVARRAADPSLSSGEVARLGTAAVMIRG